QFRSVTRLVEQEIVTRGERSGQNGMTGIHAGIDDRHGAAAGSQPPGPRQSYDAGGPLGEITGPDSAAEERCGRAAIEDGDGRLVQLQSLRRLRDKYVGVRLDGIQAGL